MARRFEFGWGESDITPRAGTVELAGQYYQRIARGCHSALQTVALVMRRQTVCIVMVSVDTVGLSVSYCERLRQALVRTIPGLAGAKIMFNATHTHSAPGLKAGRSWWARHPQALSVTAYQEQVEEGVLDAVKSAWGNLQAGGTASELENAPIGHCRRVVYADGTAEMYGWTHRDDFVGMEGGEDSGIELLFFFSAAGKPVGTVINVACPSQVMEATDQISSDFMGALRHRLKEEFGAHFHTLCQVGAAGCQSPRDLTRLKQERSVFWRGEGVEIIADKLLAAVRRGFVRAVEQVDYDPGLTAVGIDIKLPRRRVSYPEYRKAGQILQKLAEKHDPAAAYDDFCRQVRERQRNRDWVPPHDDKEHSFVLMQNQEAVVRRYLEQDSDSHFQMLLQVFRVGQVVFAGNPFELFLEYGQRIKARSPAAQTLVVQLADGSGGYLPSPRAESLGGYGGLVINGQVGADGGAILVDQTVEAIESLWK